ncbi:hypothetical protein Lfu02_32530 [Longispora fulva]|uniref:Uncharacterized protein n=1 Tax=Longispora fulva TaxID=619741 RepID=A0A8J7KLI0_9ACTN|nr:hypothetical protein [Longispora fulva]MBG6139384.1 hypothetical protein [Longispora fulva]GIG58881.1 hypothetical protein Lfu02_32530 [Longispora fulva]
MKKVPVYIVAAFVVFFIITNPHAAADVAVNIASGIGQFAAGVVGGAK